MKKRLLIFLCLGWICASCVALYAQKESAAHFRVMSYNVENYLSFRHDSLSPLRDFSPEGKLGWDATRYYNKRNNIARVITAVGKWTPPALVALCEIENREVIDDLVLHSPLRQMHYRVAHFESPDPRGIDVALLYQPDEFKPYIEKPVPVRFPNNPTHHTRDILYVGGILKNGDTLHVFVNHFPSRLGGELESERNRIIAAATLRHHVDSLFLLNGNANIIIMGDFNDYPDNRSMVEILRAKPDKAPIEPESLYNIVYSLHKEGCIGSYKHNGSWGMLDQIIISSHLRSAGSGVRTEQSEAEVFAPLFLLEEDAKGFGKHPNRTYLGPRYHGGFSDHLPVYIDLIMH